MFTVQEYRYVLRKDIELRLDEGQEYNLAQKCS